MPEVLEDEFDTVSGVGGKHLAPKRPLDYIASFLTLTLVSAALAGGGILGLRLWDTGIILSGLFAEDSRSYSDLDLAIVDGTNSGIELSIGEQLQEQGWSVVSATSLADQDPDLEPAPTTLIFVTAQEYRGEALLLLDTFPGAVIEVSTQFLTPITVLIGNDFLG
ncbi:MAG: LytR C-terminal domain-containing protein [Rhodoluna sp.]